MDRNTVIREAFGAVAGGYAVSPVHSGGPDLDAMVAAAELTGEERVLDLGCGTGHTAMAFAPRCAAVDAIDLTSQMLDAGRQMADERALANIRFREGDVCGKPRGCCARVGGCCGSIRYARTFPTGSVAIPGAISRAVPGEIPGAVPRVVGRKIRS